MQSVDVAIVGGGMVGLAVACGLQGSGLRVAVLEQRVPEPLAADAPPQLRVSAINAASEKLLTRLGVWQDILSRRASCYHGMEVWDKDSFGHISFDDQSMGYSHLGHIVENSVIHYALWNKAQQSSDITLLAPAELQQVAWGENETFLTLKDGRIIQNTSSQLERMEQILNLDEGARYIGEFAIGVNPYITKPMCETLFDEKIAGSIHFTPGAAYQDAFNGNVSAVHWDLVLIQTPQWGGGEIYFDGELIRKDGRFVPPELAGLNPENLV